MTHVKTLVCPPPPSRPISGRQFPPPSRFSPLPSGWACPSALSHSQIAINPGYCSHQNQRNCQSNRTKKTKGQCGWMLSCPRHVRASTSRTTLPGGCTSMRSDFPPSRCITNRVSSTAATYKPLIAWREISPRSIRLYITGKSGIMSSSLRDTTPIHRRLLRTVDGGTLYVVWNPPTACPHPTSGLEV